jgi:hypothetical protein
MPSLPLLPSPLLPPRFHTQHVGPDAAGARDSFTLVSIINTGALWRVRHKLLGQTGRNAFVFRLKDKMQYIAMAAAVFLVAHAAYRMVLPCP